MNTPSFTSLALLLVLSPVVNAQTCDILQDDYTNIANWTQVGTDITLSSNQVTFQNGAANGEQKRVYRPLGTTLSSVSPWSVEVDFEVLNTPTDATGHNPIAMTAGTDEPFNDCPDIPCTGLPAGTQDGIFVIFLTTTSSSSDRAFYIKAREGTGSLEFTSTGIPATAVATTYYLRLERLSATQTQLSVFSDALRTIHLAGSPVTLAIPGTIDGINTIQHSNSARGNSNRQMNGSVDNLCISSLSVLPVELLNFEAQATDAGDARLVWHTTHEINHLGFDVEHARHGEDWKKIGQPVEKSEIGPITRYTFPHRRPGVGTHYYRLKQFDQDGTFTYSQTISVSIKSPNDLSLYPNPAHDRIEVSGETPGAMILRDYSGKIIDRPVLENGSINLSHLPAGVYLLSAHVQGQWIHRRFIRQ